MREEEGGGRERERGREREGERGREGERERGGEGEREKYFFITVCYFPYFMIEGICNV